MNQANYCKSGAIVSLFGIALLLASCAKEYKCDCTSTVITTISDVLIQPEDTSINTVTTLDSSFFLVTMSVYVKVVSMVHHQPQPLVPTSLHLDSYVVHSVVVKHFVLVSSPVLL